MNKKGIIVINSYLKNEKIIEQVEILKKLFNGNGINCEIIKSSEIPVYINDKGELKADVIADFAIFYDKEQRLCKMLEKCGIRVFNTTDALIKCDDKMLTHIELAGMGIKMPLTIASPLMYSYENQDDLLFLNNVTKLLSFPLIVKENYGSLGMQVYLVKDEKELLKIYRKLKHKPHIYQQFIKSSFGKDLRLITIDKKVICSGVRASENDFRSNLAAGSFMHACVPDAKAIEIAEKVSKILDLDYASVDLLFGEDDNYYLCEVNSNAFFIGISKATGVNVGKLYVDYIISKVY